MNTISVAQRRAAMRRAGGRCERCGSQNDLRVHHKHRVHAGGGNEPENLEVVCWDCHHTEHAEERANRWGRPKPGRRFTRAVWANVDEETYQLVLRLAAKVYSDSTPRGMAGVIREGIRALAEKEGGAE